MKDKKKKVFVGLVAVTQVVLLLGMVGLFVQNSNLSKSIAQYIGTNSDIHEIWDDSKVVEAYKTGKTDELNEQDKYVLETAKKVIKDNIKEDMTPYEKEKAIYDWQVKYVNFNDSNLSPISNGEEYNHTPYGVLKYHQAICVGNATTFKLFMDILGIENQIIHSTEEGEHAWNLVKLDGDWYHVDITFDGGTFGKAQYSYFNVPDSVKDDGSYPWNHEVIPAADGSKYCYMANEAENLKDVYGLPKALKKAMDKGATAVYYTVGNQEGLTTETVDYICSAFTNEKYEVMSNTTYVIGDKTIYSISISDNDAMADDGQNQAVLEKLEKIIEKLIY